MERSGAAVAVTHGGVIKAAVVNALGAEPAAFWRVDASPLHVTVLHGRDGRWTVACVNAPVVAEGSVGGKGPTGVATDGVPRDGTAGAAVEDCARGDAPAGAAVVDGARRDAPAGAAVVDGARGDAPAGAAAP
jgi:hypothetical protein